MKKTLLILLSLILVNPAVFAALGKETKGPFGYNLYDDINRKSDAPKAEPKQENTDKKTSPKSTEPTFYGDNTEAEWENEQSYYPNANLASAVAKYKRGNYSGCLQEMISLVKREPSNPVVYYYMAMAYTQVGKKDQAVKAYEKVMRLNSQKTLTLYATRGRDCLVGGPTCTASEEQSDDLDNFINSPYGNGFSEEVDTQLKQQQLKNFQKQINKEDLDETDIEKIQKFDQKSEVITGEKIASNETSNDDILKAIETLKNAGITVSVNAYQPSQYDEFSMLMGNNNNNNNSMINMLPYLMMQKESGKDIDPQLIQSMMMNSMLPDFTFSDNKY